jgi:hypothetical protein
MGLLQYLDDESRVVGQSVIVEKCTSQTASIQFRGKVERLRR